MESRRIREAGDREAVLLSNVTLRAVIDGEKGIVPELSLRFKGGWINSHWQPWFRSNQQRPWNAEKGADFWKVPLLYDIAGNFPCAPNFGPDNKGGGYDLPPHGYTALEKWEQLEPESTEDRSILKSELKAGEHPFQYNKTDLVLKDQSVLYTRLEVKNTGDKTEPFNCGWHNTVGAPFLESGCLIDNNAKRFSVPPKGTEFDNTGRLAFGAENVTAYYANGLEQSLQNEELIGNPTYITLEPGESKRLYYGTAFFSYEEDLLDKGIQSVKPGDKGLEIESNEGKSMEMTCDFLFSQLKIDG